MRRKNSVGEKCVFVVVNIVVVVEFFFFFQVVMCNHYLHAATLYGYGNFPVNAKLPLVCTLYSAPSKQFPL